MKNSYNSEEREWAIQIEAGAISKRVKSDKRPIFSVYLAGKLRDTFSYYTAQILKEYTDEDIQNKLCTKHISQIREQNRKRAFVNYKTIAEDSADDNKLVKKTSDREAELRDALIQWYVENLARQDKPHSLVEAVWTSEYKVKITKLIKEKLEERLMACARHEIIQVVREHIASFPGQLPYKMEPIKTALETMKEALKEEEVISKAITYSRRKWANPTLFNNDNERSR